MDVAHLFNVYGPRMGDDDGRGITTLIASAPAGRPMIVYGNEDQPRSWGYNDGIADGLARLFSIYSHGLLGPVNIGNDCKILVHEIARSIASLITDTTIVHGAPVPQNPSNRRQALMLAQQLLPG